jgi:hypothetical protein
MGLRLIGVEIQEADDGGGDGLLLLIVRSHGWLNCCRLCVKLVTSVVEAYTTCPNKERACKVLYIYLAWRLTVVITKRGTRMDPPRMRSNAVGGVL